MKSIKEPFLLSSIPAGWTDQLMLKSDGNNRLVTLSSEVVARLINITVLPLFLTIDVVLQTTGCLKERLLSIICLSNASAEKHLASAYRCAALAKKCLIGILGTPLSLISPSLISLPFVAPISYQRNHIEPFGKLMAGDAHIIYPQKPQHIQEIIKEAKKHSCMVSVIGAGMSQGCHILPSKDALNPITLDLQNLELSHKNTKIDIQENERLIKTDQGFFSDTRKNREYCEAHGIVFKEKNRAVARVSAGATWQEMQNAADSKGYAIKVTQASNVFSIGGSISANSHGSAHRQGCLGNTITSMTIIDPEGKIKTLTPCDELFGYVLGGYGAFGVIVEADIVLTNNRTLKEDGEQIPLEEFVRYFEKEILSNKSIAEVVCRVPLEEENQEVILVNKFNKLNKEEDPFYHKPTPNLSEEKPFGTRLQRIASNFLRHFKFIRKFYFRHEVSRLTKGTSDQLLTRNQAMRPPLNALRNHSKSNAEWLQEYFVGGATEEERSHNVIALQKKIREVFKRYKIPLINCSWRYVNEDSRAELGYAKGKDGPRYALVLCFNQSLAPNKIQETKLWQQEVNDLVLNMGGTYYLPYQDSATAGQFKECYKEHAQNVAAKKEQFDPEKRFMNRFVEKYFVS